MSKNGLLIFFCYTAIAFIAYRNCFDIFIPADNYLYLFKAEGSAAILKNFRENVPYLVTYPLLYLLYRIFGTDPALWIATGIVFHALFSFIVFLFTKQLFKLFCGSENKAIAFFSTCIFLVSPYQTEILLWFTVNIRLVHACFAFAGLYLFLRYLPNPSSKLLLVIHFLFLLSVFSHELTWVFPLIYGMLFLTALKLNVTDLKPRAFALRIITPQLVLISFYFIVTKLISGHWFWHGGTFSDIVQTNDYSKTLLKYFAKFFLFYRYLPWGGADELLRDFSENKWGVLLLGFLLLGTIIILFRKAIKKSEATGYTLVALFAGFLISLLPVLPLDSSFLTNIYPDRYGYLPSVFFYIFIVSVIFLVLKTYAFPVLIGYTVFCWILLSRTIPPWISANEYCNALVQNYKPFQKYDQVYILNVPTYYMGVAAFRSAFAETVYLKNNSPAEKIRVISGCYQESTTDTIKSITFSGNTVTVSGPEKITPYFSTNGGWAASYETEEYTVTFSPSGCSYTLVFKQEIPRNSAFIYTSFGSWKKAS